MSTTTNAVNAVMALLHNVGANVSDSRDNVEQLFDFHIPINLPSGYDGNSAAAAANDAIVATVPYNCKLVGANYCASAALVNTATDTVLVTVSTNGVSSATLNSDTINNAAVNGVVALTVNAANSFVDAGETVHINYTMEDNTNNYLEGTLTLTFRPQ